MEGNKAVKDSNNSNTPFFIIIIIMMSFTIMIC